VIKFCIGKTEKEPKKITTQKYRQSDHILASHTNQTIAIRGRITRKGVYKSNVNKNKVPIILITCKEAREAAKATYRLTFEKELAGKKIWVEFSQDTIVFEDTGALAVFHGLIEGSGSWGKLGDLVQTLPQETTIIE
jgi:hypothetical protein